MIFRAAKWSILTHEYLVTVAHAILDKQKRIVLTYAQSLAAARTLRVMILSCNLRLDIDTQHTAACIRKVLGKGACGVRGDEF